MSLISNGVSSLGNEHTSKNGTSATDLIGNSDFAVTFGVSSFYFPKGQFHDGCRWIINYILF